MTPQEKMAKNLLERRLSFLRRTSMNKDMTRWIEETAIKGHDKESDPGHRWQDLTDWQREMVRDTIRRDVVNFLQAAAADGVKLTPRFPNIVMQRIVESGDTYMRAWERQHDAAPNYLDDDA